MPRVAKWKQFSIEELSEIIKDSFSNREVARKLGYSDNGGGTMQSLKKMYEELEFDTSHFLGQGWNKENYNYDSFNNFSYKKKGKTTVTLLIKLRGHQCEKCKLTEWLNMPINLEVHHIDGNRNNNHLDNLILLCPNCHSYTPNFTKSFKKSKTDEEFIAALNAHNNIHQSLKFLGLTPTGGNYERAYRLIEEYNITHLKN